MSPAARVSVERTMLSVEEVAQRWGVNGKTIYAAITAGQFRAIRIGRVWRIPTRVAEAGA